MITGKKHKEIVEKLEKQIEEAKVNAVEETTDAVTKSNHKINQLVKKSLLNMAFCFEMAPQEHRFVTEFIRIYPQLAKNESFNIAGLDSPISPLPAVALDDDQKRFFSQEYDLRTSPHDGANHLKLIENGDVNSTLTLFNKIMQRHIQDVAGVRVRQQTELLVQANNAFNLFEEFVNQTASDAKNRFARIEGGSQLDRDALISRFLSKTGKTCEVIQGEAANPESAKKIQPVDLMRALVDKDVIFILDPNSIANLKDLIIDILNVEDQVLVVFGDTFDLGEFDSEVYRINKEDEGVFKAWDYS